VPESVTKWMIVVEFCVFVFGALLADLMPPGISLRGESMSPRMATRHVGSVRYVGRATSRVPPTFCCLLSHFPWTFAGFSLGLGQLGAWTSVHASVRSSETFLLALPRRHQQLHRSSPSTFCLYCSKPGSVFRFVWQRQVDVSG